MHRSPAKIPDLPHWHRLRRRFYYLLTVATLMAVRCLPQRVGRGLCGGLARAALRVRSRERHRAQQNLALAFPDLTVGERDRLLRQAVDALGRNLYDSLALEKLARRDFATVVDEGTVDAVRRLQSRGRGVLLLTGHLGCWELLGAYLASRLDGLAVVTGSVHNAPVDQLLQERRRRWGLTPLPRERDLRPVLRYLRRGGVVAVLLDQNTRVHNVDVPFFGRPAPTPAGFAKLALRYRLPVLPVAIERCAEGYRVVHLPPLPLEAGSSEVAVERFLGSCNAALELFIRRNPAEWVWFHERWPAGPGSDRTGGERQP